MDNIAVKAAQARTSLLTHGYAVVEDIVSPSIVADVRGFLAEQTNDAVDAALKELNCDSRANLIDLAGRIAAGGSDEMSGLSKSARDTLTGHFPLEVRLSQRLWQIPLWSGINEVLRACLDSQDIYMHMPPTARFVLSGNIHAGVPAHQDISYNEHMSSFITMWVPLVDISDECGGVVVYEGSGQTAVQDAPASEAHYWRQAVDTMGFKPRHMVIKAGDILLLNRYIVHGSAANRSDRTRLSIDFRIFGERDSSSKHYLDLQSRQVVEPRL